jgi:hypothetical protein
MLPPLTTITLATLLTTSTAVRPSLTIDQPDVPLFPSPLPPRLPQTQSEDILSLFSTLGRTTAWSLIQRIPLLTDTGEPEGMIVLPSPEDPTKISRIILGAGNWTTPTKSYGNGTIINGTDRANGEGSAHIVIFNGTGHRIADARLTEEGEEEYHIGGLDYDGRYIWATLAEYRPNSTATVIRIDPSDMSFEKVVRVGDHLGGIVHDSARKRITCLNWGSRNATLFQVDELNKSVMKRRVGVEAEFIPPNKVVRNPSYFIDYQDCKFLGHHGIPLFNQHSPHGDDHGKEKRALMLCSGVATLQQPNNVTIGGIAVVDTETMVPVMEVPIALQSELGTMMTQNPVDVAVVEGRLRVYWLPDQRNSTLYVFEAEGGRFQYGGDGGL